MSIICTSESGWLISHADYISKIYNSKEKIRFKKELFEINVPYTKKKLKQNSRVYKNDQSTISKEEISSIQNIYKTMYSEFKEHFNETKEKDNSKGLQLSEEIYDKTRNLPENFSGGNIGAMVKRKLTDSWFLFPENCRFFSRDVAALNENLSGYKFDFILLDPPWWNKYIRRKRKKSPHAYSMMYTEDLKKLDLAKILNPDGLVAVWCTNCAQHYKTLIENIFPVWGVKFISKWYWLKITQSGEPVCNFSEPPGKQPFEQIVFGCQNDGKIANGKVVISVPSALHSHKPPLVELLSEFLPEKPKCLEIFARYLLPNWTSYGNEVLKFQQESLYDIEENSEKCVISRI